MLPQSQKTIIVSTPKHHRILISCFHDFIRAKDVKVNKRLFLKMCQAGCRNYGKKYCCPPYSPDFNSYVSGKTWLLILLLVFDLKQINEYREYHRIRLANNILKIRTEKIMRRLEKRFKTKFLGTGACRLCRPCKKELNQPCRYPQKMRYSLESLGVDCNFLTQKLFKKPLLWYKNKKAPQYTSVICALPIEQKDKREVSAEVEKLSSVSA